MDSILDSVKKLLGITAEYRQFDADLIIHINSVFSILYQMGVGPEDGFSIEDESATWQDFSEDRKVLEAVKTYINLKVRLMFDPPASSQVTDSINKMISELEWRLNVESDIMEE